METIVSSEQDLIEFNKPIPNDVVMIYFKMVGVGPQTLAKAEFNGIKICEVVRDQTGYFILSNGGAGLREAMHDLVNRFCDSQEKMNESK